MYSSLEDSGEFLARNAFFRCTKKIGAAGLYFDKNESGGALIKIQSDNIDFAETAVVVFLQNNIILGNQKFFRVSFSQFAD